MDTDRLADLSRHRLARVQRSVRILEHHLHAPVVRAQAASFQRPHVDPGVTDAAAIGFMQPDQAPRQRRFAAAGLADDRQGFPAFDKQIDAVQRVHAFRRKSGEQAAQASAPRKTLVQITNFKQRRIVGLGHVTTDRTRSA